MPELALLHPSLTAVPTELLTGRQLRESKGNFTAPLSRERAADLSVSLPRLFLSLSRSLAVEELRARLQRDVQFRIVLTLRFLSGNFRAS